MTIVLADQVAVLTLIFARIGAAVMVLPIFGEGYVLARARLVLALGLSVLLAPLVAPTLPAAPQLDAAYAARVASEVVHGLFLGSFVRLAVMALSVAGGVVAMQMGFAAANFFSPAEAQQSSVTGNLFTVAGFAGLLALDGHHMILRGLVASYDTLPPGIGIHAADMAAAMARGSADAMALALQMAMPMTAAAVIMYALMGMMNRLVPSLQVIFVALPVQLLLGIGLLGLTVGGVVRLFAGFVHDLNLVLGA